MFKNFFAKKKRCDVLLDPMPIPVAQRGEKTKEKCKHLNFIVRSYDLIGQGYCPDCKEEIFLSDAFNNLADELRKAVAKCKQSQ